MPRFSIVLTTCDRPELLAAAVQAVLEMRFDDFELIVSDNFSAAPARELLAGVADPRLRIVRTDRRLAVSDHWEFAYQHVRGAFVMYIGDDNALHPDILAFADRAIRTHGLEVVSWRVASYFHPDWDVTYGPLPNRGNVIGIDAGTTDGLYAVDETEVLRQFCQSLRLSGCFPCMLNFVFPKARADAVRARTGRFFWEPNPDIAATYFVLGTIEPGRFGFFDGFGAIGGRSRNSNLASLLSRGRNSRRAYEYIEDFRDKDCLPHHPIKYICTSNTLAATVSQGRALMPERFGAYAFEPKTLALRTIDDMYVDRIVPWVEDRRFLDGVEAFFASLPAAAGAEVRAYRDRCLAKRRQAEAKGEPEPHFIRNADEAAVSLLEFWRTAGWRAKAFAWQLYRDTGRNPLGRYWEAGGTSYVDMRLYDGHSIADAARSFPDLLRHFDRRSDAFLRYHRHIGMLGKELPVSTPARPRAPLAAADAAE